MFLFVNNSHWYIDIHWHNNITKVFVGVSSNMNVECYCCFLHVTVEVRLCQHEPLNAIWRVFEYHYTWLNLLANGYISWNTNIFMFVLAIIQSKKLYWFILLLFSSFLYVVCFHWIILYSRSETKRNVNYPKSHDFNCSHDDMCPEIMIEFIYVI